MHHNVLNDAFTTPFATVPFDKISEDDFIPAMVAAIEQGKKEIEDICYNSAPPDYQNTIVALEQAGEHITRISKIIFHLNSAETNPEIQKNVRVISPMLTEFNNDITMNSVLFARIKQVWHQRGEFDLDTEDMMLLEKTYKRFNRNGANLSDEDKDTLRAINKELADLTISFSENVLNETNEFTLHVTEIDDLDGLPPFVVEAAELTAQRLGLQGWVFTLQAPSYSPFMQYAANRKLREKMFRAFNSRCAKGNKFDNQELLHKIVHLRYDKAQLLGYETWADYVLEERMAHSKETVFDFLHKLKSYALPAAEKEMEELTAYAKSHGFEEDQLQRWDVLYYTEKLKKEKYQINDEILKPYFKLENVLDGLFKVAHHLYGLTFKRNMQIAGWHEDVVAYEVSDETGKLMAIWYGDYFPRSGKRAGAWNNNLRAQRVENGIDIRPHVVNVCNFSKPTETKPSLLTYVEVVTLFHEFGHALHDILSEGKYSSISGTSVLWDFVELPSQLMENFVTETEVLKLFAKHYQTGEILPDEWIHKIKESATFMTGINAIRQLSLGLIDMYWHAFKPTDKSVFELEKEADITHTLYPETEGFSVSPAFSHIFAGGYSAGYYSYKWSEVLDADAFDLFKQKGIFNKEVSTSFRQNILSKGGSEKPIELYIKFRGRQPNPEAMLRRSGLMKV
jgi:peptidyl-dipeptidase Dcp